MKQQYDKGDVQKVYFKTDSDKRTICQRHIYIHTKEIHITRETKTDG